ncbi:MAG: sigma 54-dependent Fis family transcriptional regulator [Deltaproteobacteria bacterium]|nr:sigma 54-dependent Fis family transcriptional regulator [Deltaproteobacteria bacterium]
MSDASPTVPHLPAKVSARGLVITVVSGPDAGRQCAAEVDSISVGSAAGNDLRLSDETVSRFHLEARTRGDRIHVRDFGSTKGTLAGPVAIEQGAVEPGSILTLGKTGLRVDVSEVVDVPLRQDERMGALAGRSSVMRRLMADIERVARSTVSVLLVGETGSGKEVVARAIHDASARAAGPFEIVDCGVLAPALVASELFGHERGAFTGATERRVGAFERAHGGTLFLDEIGELPLALQAALLGAIERRSFKRVGGDRPVSVDVRLICATHRDLRQEVNGGGFRQDLYFRIAVVLMLVPSLRERPDDIPVLAEHFLREAGYDGAIEAILPESVMSGLARHSWPGNVRELRNFVEAALAMGATSPAGVDPAAGTRDPARFPTVPLEDLLTMSFKDARERLLTDFEQRYLLHLLERSQANVTHAARIAEMHRSYLNLLLKKHRLR